MNTLQMKRHSWGRIVEQIKKKGLYSYLYPPLSPSKGIYNFVYETIDRISISDIYRLVKQKQLSTHCSPPITVALVF